MRNEPLVSIITPAYNCQDVLHEAIESVRNQSYANWEHIIIDDCSKDGTREVIAEYASEDSRVRPIYSSINTGVASARNMGIAAARGKYIAFLDSDDLWKPDKLKKQIGYMEQEGLEFTYSDYEIINYEGRFIKNVINKKKRVDYKELLKTNQIGCLTAVIKTEAIKTVMMPSIKHEDYATWLGILKGQISHAYRFDEILASYRRTKGSVSSNKLRTIAWTWNIYRRNQQLGFIQSLKQIIIFGFFTTIKYAKR